MTRIEQLKELKNKRDKGEMTCIPFFESFPRFSTVIPGIMKGIMYAVTANSGVGKSKFTKYAFIKSAYDYIQKHPENKLKLKVLYFALEESREEFEDSIICMRLAELHGIHVDPLYIQSFRKNQLSNEILKLIEADAAWRSGFLQSVEVIDQIYNPTGIYKYCKKVAEQLGTIKTTRMAFPTESGGLVSKDVFDSYLPYDPNLYVVAVVDHLNLLSGEKGAETRHAAMGRWVTQYARKHLCKNWRWATINVIQQSAESEKQQFIRGTGESIHSKVEPSLDGLGNNKEIQRDHHVILGLFNPGRFGIENYRKWNIRKMGRFFRHLIVLKNRIGNDQARMSLFFEGASGLFKELPQVDDKTQIDLTYRKMANIEKEVKERQQ